MPVVVKSAQLALFTRRFMWPGEAAFEYEIPPTTLDDPFPKYIVAVLLVPGMILSPALPLSSITSSFAALFADVDPEMPSEICNLPKGHRRK